VTAGLLAVFMLRIVLAQGWYIVCYAHAIYLLNLLLAFLQPKFDPSLQEDLLADEIEGGGEQEASPLPSQRDDEFRPFVRRLPEWQFWLSATRATAVALICTTSEVFDVPVYWPILVVYFFVLFTLTMRRQLQHMLKYNYITSNKLTLIAPSPVQTGETGGENEREIVFVSRILSILPMHLTATPWTGPLDHDLMGFHEIVKALYRSLRNSLEMTLVSLFLSHKIHMPPQECTRVSFQLPFFQQNSTAMGIAVKAFLIGNAPVSALQSRFPNCSDLAGDLRAAVALPRVHR